MKIGSLGPLFRILIVAVLFVVLSLSALGALVFLAPKKALVFTVNHLAPGTHFAVDSVKWKTRSCLLIENVQWGDFLKIPKVTLRWKWKQLWKQRLEELKLERANAYINLRDLDKLGADASVPGPSEQSHPGSHCWHLDRLILERGGLVMIGVGPTLPPLSLEFEGEWDDIPLGSELSEEDLQKKRSLEFRNLNIHSPVDLAVSIFKTESVKVEFRFAGLQIRQLDSLVFQRPVLDVDRSFFWFVDELRKPSTAPTSSSPTGPDWKVKNFHLREGRLDIRRLHEISIQYPFEFEVSRQDLSLRDLSLAQFQIELLIPKQDLLWHAMGISFKNLYGKIAFNLNAPKVNVMASLTNGKPANDLVNTLYVDVIRWRKLELNSSWLVLTFDPTFITGAYGGAFASGYINGGVTCGWSDQDPWRLWGSAAGVDVGEVSKASNNEAVEIDGRAKLIFDLEGKQAALKGDLKLDSLSTGILRMRPMQSVLDRIEKNTEGVRREALKTLIDSLREYPYGSYLLEAHYLRPNGQVNFKSESERGTRKLEINWHGKE